MPATAVAAAVAAIAADDGADDVDGDCGGGDDDRDDNDNGEDDGHGDDDGKSQLQRLSTHKSADRRPGSKPPTNCCRPIATANATAPTIDGFGIGAHSRRASKSRSRAWCPSGSSSRLRTSPTPLCHRGGSSRT